MPEDAPLPRRSRLALAFGLAAVTVAAGLVRYAGTWDEPWDRSAASICAVVYHGLPIQNWMRLGFDATRGVPMLAALPTHPPVGGPSLHHPPLFDWMMHAAVARFGFTEHTFRMVPAIFSALCGGLLAWVAARGAGLAWGCAAAALWLVLPMSFLFGNLCNPESAALLLVVLTVVLHRGLRTRALAAYAPVLVAQFAAGQLEWQGFFAGPAVLAYELFQPRGGRRLGRVVLLACACAASAAVVIVLHGYLADVVAKSWRMVEDGVPGVAPAWELSAMPRYFAMGLSSMSESARVGGLGAGISPSVAEWAGAQLRYAFALFTWPAVVATVAGIVMAFFRRDDALRLGVCLLVPGVLNALVFRVHASTHPYWTYFGAAGVVLTTVEVLRILARPRLLALALLLAIAVFSVVETGRYRASWRTTEVRDVAAELDALIPEPDPILLCDGRIGLSVFYTRHWAVAPYTLDNVLRTQALKRAGKLDRPVKVVAVPPAPDSPISDVEGVLSKLGTARRLEPAELAARCPTISRVVSPGPLWLVDLE